MENILIRNLEPFQNTWSLKAIVIRKGIIEKYETKKRELLEVLKVIVMDEEGIKIQITLYNDLIKKFNDLLEKGKVYIIRNGKISTVNRRYLNVHNEIEIAFTNSSEIELMQNVSFCNKKINHVDFTSITNNFGSQVFDIVGVVISVKPTTLIKSRNLKEKFAKKRDAFLLDKSFNTMKLTMWADLAEHEGGVLEKNNKECQIIVVSNVKVTCYEDEISLTTTNISDIAINPPVEEIECLRKKFEYLFVEKKLSHLLIPSKRFRETSEVCLEDIILGKVKGEFCTFIGRIVKIQNKESMWFEKCTSCNGRVYPIGDAITSSCSSCNNESTSFVRRFMSKMIVSDGDSEAYITIFDGTEHLVGCNVVEYFNDLSKVQKRRPVNISKDWFWQKTRNIIFFVRLDMDGERDRARRQIVVQELCTVSLMAEKKCSLNKDKGKRVLEDVEIHNKKAKSLEEE